MGQTNTDLLADIELRAAIPISQTTFTNAQILSIATSFIYTELLPKLLATREEFLAFSEDLATTKRPSDIYAWIRIPSRAVGQAIVSVCNTSDDSEIDACSYWIEGSKVFFERGIEGTYRIKYRLRPSKLVTVASCARITAIDTSTNTVTCSSLPSTFTSSLTYDFVRANAGFDVLSIDKAGTVSGTDIVFSELPSELSVGDYVCLSDQSPIPQIPVEWFPYLAQHTAVEILDNLGDEEAAKAAERKLKRMERNVLSIVSPRTEKKPKIFNRYS